jgi:high-affinity nickel-transport protein
MPETVANLASLLLLGFVLGMRHATDADHVIAVATIVGRQRSLAGSAMIGVAWGVGHTLTILAVGSAIILFGVVIPPRLGLAMEFAVGVMLIILGLLALTGMGAVLRAAAAPLLAKVLPGYVPLSGEADHSHLHVHGDYIHRHPQAHGAAGHGHGEDKTVLAALDARFRGFFLYQWLRPLVVGIVHGLAGSAAVALLVLTAVPEPIWAIAYLLLFGVGTVAGMMLITVALAAPFALTAHRLPRFNWQLRAASGLLSFVFGLFLIYEIGFIDGGLFSASPVWEPR